MFFRIIIFIILFLGLGVSARADFDIELWAARSAIIPPTLTGKDFVVLNLPNEFFTSLKSDLSDLRIVSDDGETPYAVAIERELNTFNRVPTRMLNLSTISGESTSFLVDVGAEGVFHNALVIDTPSENFRRIVEVQGSNDQVSWRTLNPRGQIFDYTVRDIKPVSIEHTRVDYPDSTFRYLLVTILDRGEASLAIRGVRLERQISLPAKEIRYDSNFKVSENEKENTTEVIVDLGSQGLPHRRGILGTSAKNFSRAVEIYTSNDQKDWQFLSNSYIFSIDTPRFVGSQLEFTYPESNRRYLKLVVQNRDDKPISLSSISIFGVVRRVVFEFDPQKNYFVYLGNDKAKRPIYDIERISQYLDAAELNRVNAGPVELNPFYNPPKPPLVERSPYFLPVVLGFVILLLALLLLRVFMKSQGGKVSSTPLT